ncbi:MAG: TIGR03643 family protein, partial [Methylophilaceae bacterium]
VYLFNPYFFYGSNYFIFYGTFFRKINPRKMKKFNEEDISRLIEMAWEDRTSLDAIKRTYGIDESELKIIMKNNLSMNAYKLWRKRMKNSHLRHESLRPKGITRAYCSTQYKLKN